MYFSNLNSQLESVKGKGQRYTRVFNFLRNLGANCLKKNSRAPGKS